MPGLADYAAENLLNQALGVTISASRFLALFNTAPTSDAGTGGTEVSGGAYARPQVAGNLAAGASWTTASTTITLGSAAPSWLTALGTTANPGYGVNVYDVTAGQQIGTVSSILGAAVTLQAAAAHASSGAADSLQFSIFPMASASSGSEPSVTPVGAVNGAQVNFPTATANWSATGAPTLAWGLYDAVSAGNLWLWDYLGSSAWLPATMTSASPGVITAHAHGYTTSSIVVASAKVGGAIPSFSQSNLTGPLVPANVTTDTFTVTNGGTAVNTSSSGDFLVRAIQEQAIPSGVQTYFPAGSLTASAA